MKTTDIERLLREDSIEKRKAGRGESHRASQKKGFKGSVKFPVDLLRGKERKAYMAENTTKTILTYEEFMKCDKPQRRKILLNLLNKYTRREVADVWGVRIDTVHAHVARLGGDMPGGKEPKKPDKLPLTEPELLTKQEDTIEALTSAPFTITLSITEPGKDLQNRLRTILATLAYDKKYQIELSLTELE